ncbi:MAG: hypothetical protein HY272_06995 [Gammaproteobacteria bacterium]|nr:hypothetical protein [Gammaproteobacteria bacterium]
MGGLNYLARGGRSGIGLTAISAAIAAVMSTSVHAEVYTVSTVGELKEAVIKANASPVADVIKMAEASFVLGDVDGIGSDVYSAFPIEGELTIEGQGMNKTLLQRNGAAKNQFRFFHVGASAKLTLRNLNLSGGSLDYYMDSNIVDKQIGGGAVENEGELVVESVKFFSNSAATGGAIANSPNAKLTVSDSIFWANHTTRNWDSDGGAIFNNAGTASIKRSTFQKNFTSPTKDDSGNVVGATQSDGGAIENSIGYMEVIDSTFISNTSYCGGAIENAKGKLLVVNSTFNDNHGLLHAGAIYGSEPRLNGDESLYGGGLIDIQNSTMSGNHAGIEGGGGVYADAGIVTLKNNLIAGNDSTAKGPDCGFNDTDLRSPDMYKQSNNYPSMILVAGNNLIGDLTECKVESLKGTSSLIITGANIAGLETLADSGVPGNAHFPLKSTSLAINQGQDCKLTQDQLGNGRVGAACDLGAIEQQMDVASVFVGDEFKKTIVGTYEIPDFYTQSNNTSPDTSSATTSTAVESSGSVAASAGSDGAGGGGALNFLGLFLFGLPMVFRLSRKQ